MNEQLRVLVIQEGSGFYAQCLDYDVAAQGKTEEEAMSRLQCTLQAEYKEAVRNGRTLADIGPAPDKFHALYSTNVVSRETVKMVA